MLDQLGANLIKASSGREALEQLLKQEITLVLMDVSMPDLDGFELAEIIREHPRFRKTAIIFVSAVHLTDMDRLKGYASGRRRLRGGPGPGRAPPRQGQRLHRASPEDRRGRAARS